SRGCSDCCRGGLSVTLVEAAHIAEGVADLAAEKRAAMEERAAAVTELAQSGAHDSVLAGPCAALDPADGSCAIYAWRPIICRSHGAPIRRRGGAGRAPAGEPGSVHLPVLDPDGEPTIDVCHK